MNSMFLRLAKNDFIKGLIVAMVGAALGVIIPAVKAGTVLDLSVLQGAAQLGIGAGIAYLTKNLFTNSEGKIGPEVDGAVALLEGMKREAIARRMAQQEPRQPEDPNGITGA